MGEFEYYSIFCGVFLYDGIQSDANKSWVPWLSRLKDTDGYATHIRRTYYDTYLHSIVPEIVAPDPDSVRHLTQAKTYTGSEPIRAVIQSREFKISYIDVLLFPGQIGIYYFKVDSADGQGVSAAEISSVLAFFRSRESEILVDNKRYAVDNYLHEFLGSVVKLAPNWDKFSPQLKSYTIINDTREGTFGEAQDVLLFELSNAIPVGSYQHSPLAPSQAFFDKTFETNCISIFSNWKALSLFDSFTRLSVNARDPFGTWELDFFNIYALCLYAKYQLYYFNSQLTNVIKVSREAQQLKNRFIEFVNDHNHAYISYKFLPNHLYEQIRRSLSIQNEIDQIQMKSLRLSEAYSELKSRQLNTLILVLSLLSVISVLTDISEWLSKMGLPESLVYSIPFALSVTVIPGLVFFLFRWRRLR